MNVVIADRNAEKLKMAGEQIGEIAESEKKILAQECNLCEFSQLETLKDARLSAHLLIPGFVYTPMVSRYIPQKPPFAWTAEQTVDFMFSCLKRGDFYILCPDNETPREIDEKRIQWNTDDLIKNRPALSRWHPDYREKFKKFKKLMEN